MNAELRLPIARVAAFLSAVVVVLGLAAGPAHAAVLHLDGVGPLRLGMLRSDALDTGWLSGRRPGCELGGPPIPIDYRVRGRGRYAAVRGFAEFSHGRLGNLTFSRGVKTVFGVEPGRTTPAEMVARYRRAGYRATAVYDSVFQGTFVSVSKRGRTRISGFATSGVVGSLGLPYIPVCE